MSNFSRLFVVLILLAALPTTSPAQTSSLKERKDREGYILNLRELIKKSKSKIERVDEKLQDQARLRRNQQREDKAREYYEKGNLFFDQGKILKAQEYWERAIKITEHPEMRGYVRTDVLKSKKREKAFREAEHRRIDRLEQERGYTAREVEEIYTAAISLYKQAKYLPAKTEFEKVEEMFPDHKGTRSYLKLIDQHIQENQEQKIAEVAGESMEDAEDKELWKKALKVREEERQRRLHDQADKLYEEAVRLHQDHRYEEAKDKFKEVEWLRPDYKKTVRYLERIDTLIARRDERQERGKKSFIEKIFGFRSEKDKPEEKDWAKEHMKWQKAGISDNTIEETETLYNQAKDLFYDREYDRSRATFEQALSLIDDYKDSASYLERIERIQLAQIRIFENSLKGITRSLKPDQVDQVLSEDEYYSYLRKEADIIYEEAEAAYREKNFTKARELFLQVSQLHAKHRSTEKFLDELMAMEPNNRDRLMAHPVVVSPAAVSAPDQTRTGAGQFDHDLVRKMERDHDRQLISQAEQKYRQAVAFYNTGDFNEAKMKFIQVQALYPNYKETLDYLGRIDSDIARRITGGTASSPKSPSFAGTAAASRPVEDEAREVGLIDAVDEMTARALKGDDLEALYKEAVALYRAGRYAEAEEKFQVIRNARSGYRASDDYLERIQTAAGRSPEYTDPSPAASTLKEASRVSSADDDINRIYNEAITAFRAQRFTEARNLFQDVQNRERGFRLTEKYLRTIDRELGGESPASRRVVSDSYEPVGSPSGKPAATSVFRQSDIQPWEKELQKRQMLLKAKEYQLNTLQGRRYRRLKSEIEKEREEIERFRKMREEGVSRRKRLLKREVEREEKIREQNRVYQDFAQKLNTGRVRADETGHPLNQDIARREKDLARKKAERLDDVRQTRPGKEASKAHPATETIDRQAEELARLKKEREQETRKQRDARFRDVPAGDLPVPEDPVAEAFRVRDILALYETVPPDERLIYQYEYRRLKMDQARKKAKKDLDNIRNYRDQVRSAREKHWEETRRVIRRKIDENEELKAENFESRADQLYSEAESLFRQERYLAARAKFASAEAIMPDYKGTRKYIQRIDKTLNISQESPVRPSKSAAKNKYQPPAYTPPGKERRGFLSRIFGAGEDDRSRPMAASTASEEKLRERLERERLARQRLEKKVDQLAKRDYVPPQDPELDRQREKLGESRRDYTRLKDEELQAEREKARAMLMEAHEKKLEQTQRERQLREEEERERVRREREREREAERREQERIREAQRKVEKLYDESLGLYALNKVPEAKAKFRAFEELLEKESFSSDYRIKWRERVVRDRERMERRRAREQARKDRIAELRDRELNKEQHIIEQRREEKLKELAKKLEKEEEILKQEKAEQQKELERVRDRVENASLREKLEQADQKAERKYDEIQKEHQMVQKRKPFGNEGPSKELVDEKEREMMARAKQNELDELVRERQEQLRRERERIQRDFEENLERLYRNGVKMFRDKNAGQAHRIFHEIEQMKPDYRKTRHYLSELRAGTGVFTAHPSDDTRAPVGYSRITVRPSSDDFASEEPPRKNIIAQALDDFERKYW